MSKSSLIEYEIITKSLQHAGTIPLFAEGSLLYSRGIGRWVVSRVGVNIQCNVMYNRGTNVLLLSLNPEETPFQVHGSFLMQKP